MFATHFAIALLQYDRNVVFFSKFIGIRIAMRYRLEIVEMEKMSLHYYHDEIEGEIT